MAIDFPSSPANNEVYTQNGLSYKFNSVTNAWISIVTSIANVISVQSGQVVYSDNGSANGSYGLYFDASANTLYLNTINVTGNLYGNGAFLTNLNLTSANSYAGAMANAANNYASTIVAANLVTALSYTNSATISTNTRTDLVVAANLNTALVFANTKLANTSGISFNGNIFFPTGSMVIGSGVSSTYRLYVNGSFAAITKSFVIDHPTKSDMKLRYGSLEGPENGVYVRGKIHGYVIELPDYWTGLVDEDTITVQLTAIGETQSLHVVEVNDNKVIICGENGSMPYCYYTIYGERKDVDKLIVEY